ncbi:TPA: GTP cyclohydrolase I FolE2 [Burkholderia cepacia ATCC 25416]|uniref:GTP cyclohydrolase FolE2 n=1 Tax=Burkholderia cepacia TaxID=292 RepID=UPI001CF37EBB|nr:GTP cyclohydrolase FolE2 [Burkholderia cepacia]HDR9767660.1 GTP cyclohydrolase I FolE2 [Burkholderia cepacia ATCC 25416]MCA8078626.1 GTP cyclohydrolase FolE2 [Burkholderia cepacia]HDR9775371.1 GTP cyclohydrolase I FolE2 [Burkholderia cepacia ATCC 25416]HDR9784911.1 GTP cyclohydrolase I FolE2 [Burkholderia cepacia ATCC 25416]HDR9791086.1 GTP cyclohydrolase I FolE2 [Burkholderia cepacia ATCC 25416]
MNAPLPDISLTDAAPGRRPLEWVGMQGIDLPVAVAEPGCRRDVHARADVQVDLPAPHVKGIHMSRLYRLLDGLGDGDALSPAGLRPVLQAMVDSHRDCDTRRARLRLRFDLLARRAALVTDGLAGWKAYPVRIDATLTDAGFELRAQVTVVYSSTCPCSAALSRHWVEQAFLAAFGRDDRVEPAAVAAWLKRHATAATPHSQRSEAVVSAGLPADGATLGLIDLIDRVEHALGTPVQTAVKRADEQAFAVLNGGNLMFVEDAARRVQDALDGRHAHPRVHVRHLESLHPHDAVAWAAPVRDGADAC